MNEEKQRLQSAKQGPVPPWDLWGPFVAERSWGTVREDYSEHGDAWSYFSFDDAITRTYRWGDDAIAGWCDRYQLLLFAPVFWNGKDLILKERLFGLSSHEGNHGEDGKEIYFHLDGTPTHSYMKYLYRYPQDRFPYEQLREESRKRGTADPEWELWDSDVLKEGRYFDISIEYAKEDEEEWCVRIEAINRGKEEADLHILPHLWFRNRWSWGKERSPRPNIVTIRGDGAIGWLADDRAAVEMENLPFRYRLGERYLYASEGGTPLYTHNETAHIPGTPHCKDAFHRAVVQGNKEALLERDSGTKACFHYQWKKIPPGGSRILLFRCSPSPKPHPLKDVDSLVQQRRAEADRFYRELHPPSAPEDVRLVQRRALAGILWSKQIYLYDVNVWLKGDNPSAPPPASRNTIRNFHWRHLNSMRLLLMPDKWEYPYFCAWDQAFHTLTLSLVDMQAAKEQLWLLLFDQFQHPNGEIPSCEWEFSDKNPPVQAWALWRLYEREKRIEGKGDREFLEKCFHKLLINFAWWVNKVDSSGNNVFEGGFLGLDNITLLDRSLKLPSGATLEQSDGTGWMAVFCLHLMRMSLELAEENSVYESLATKFFEHFVYIAHAMKNVGNRNHELWSNRDGFFYDVLSYPNGSFAKFRVRSAVGIIPLFAVDILSPATWDNHPEFKKNFDWFLANRPELVRDCVVSIPRKEGNSYLLSLVNRPQLESMLRYLAEPSEFLSSFGLRSLSRFHEQHPFEFEGKRVGYEPAESLQKIKGGNSNWRGPVWMNINYLLIHSLHKFHEALGDEVKVPRAEGDMSIEELNRILAQRLISIFTKNPQGERPFWGERFPFHGDPSWEEQILFYEYYHPETGQGLGAAHQTGWSALVANLIEEFHQF